MHDHARPMWRRGRGARLSRRAVALAALTLAALAVPQLAAASQPNVLIVNTDDQRGPDTLQAMPKTRAWLQAGGRIFWRGVVTTPSCCPSRSSLMTGEYVHNHGVRQQALISHFPEYRSLQHYLHAHGYLTGIIGKYLNTWNLANRPPDFDRDAVLDGGYTNQYWNMDGVKQLVPGYTTTIMSDKAVSFLQWFKSTNDAKPWYLYVAPTAPHPPFTPEPKYASYPIAPWSGDPAVNENTSDKPPFLRNHAAIPWSTISSTRVTQLRTLKSVDDMVGRIHDLLQSQGELQNTLVIYTSDNGYEWGEHRWISKFVPYTESIRVPLIMDWPGHVAAGTSDNRFAANIDIMPTVLQAAGIAPDPRYPLDGRSLLEPNRRWRLLFEYWNDPANGAGINGWASDRTDTYQYIEDYRSDGTLLMREYYDLRSDPWELTNLYADGNPSNDPPVKPLHDQLAADRSCVGTSCP
jgi:arylsulfatase A-like enzyme